MDNYKLTQLLKNVLCMYMSRTAEKALSISGERPRNISLIRINE